MTTRIRAAALLLVVLVVGSCRPSTEEADDTETEVEVQIAEVARTTLHRYVNAYGRVAAKPALGGHAGGAATLAASAPGIVRAVLVSEGQAVHAGDLVIRLEDRIVLADVARARSRVRLAQQELEREKTLFKDQNTSQKHLQEAEGALATAQADLGMARGALAQVQLRSPLDGLVSRVHVSPGQAVDANTVAVEIVDLNDLVVVAQVPAQQGERLENGQSAEVRSERAGTPPTAARVSYVSPQVDTSTGTVMVRLTLDENSTFKPGRFVRVEIVVEERKDRLAVPVASVYTSPEGDAILSVVADGVAHRKAVRTGLRDGDQIEVESDELEPGMTVVTVGSYALPDGSRVRVRPSAEPKPATDE